MLCTVPINLALLFAEAELVFESPLKDLTVPENDTTVLECRLNKPAVRVKWLQDGKEILLDDRTKMISDGNTLKLIREKTKMADKGQYTVAIDDLKTSANLTVTGKVHGCGNDFLSNFR